MRAANRRTQVSRSLPASPAGRASRPGNQRGRTLSCARTNPGRCPRSGFLFLRGEQKMNAMALRLNKAGVPAAWLRLEEAAVLYCRRRVLWTLGEARLRLRGGLNRNGERSVIDLAPIVACEGRVHDAQFV